MIVHVLSPFYTPEYCFVYVQVDGGSPLERPFAAWLVASRPGTKDLNLVSTAFPYSRVPLRSAVIHNQKTKSMSPIAVTLYGRPAVLFSVCYGDPPVFRIRPGSPRYLLLGGKCGRL